MILHILLKLELFHVLYCCEGLGWGRWDGEDGVGRWGGVGGGQNFPQNTRSETADDSDRDPDYLHLPAPGPQTDEHAREPQMSVKSGRVSRVRKLVNLGLFYQLV